MNTDVIREWLSRHPFEPFELHLSNGEVYPVVHPELVLLTKTRLVLNYDPDRERLVHLSLIHVNSIHPLAAASNSTH